MSQIQKTSHTHTHSLSYPHTHSLSLTHTHTHTRTQCATHTTACTHTHACKHTMHTHQEKKKGHEQDLEDKTQTHTVLPVVSMEGPCMPSFTE